jgi:hypothetical protein
MTDLPLLDPDDHHTMDFAAIIEGKFTRPDLGRFIEHQMMPIHAHRLFAPLVSAEEFEQRVTPLIHLLVRRLRVNRILCKTGRRLSGVSPIPPLGNRLHELLEFSRVRRGGAARRFTGEQQQAGGDEQNR